jgi:protein-tyrosine phosphatase
MTMNQSGVLFVCLGNICRSPLAEGIFIHLAREQGVLDQLNIDSCGTGGWHVGNRADPRSLAVASKYGIELPSRARQLDQEQDFARFAWIIAMDRSNRDNLIASGADVGNVHLMMAFHPDHTKDPEKAPDVPDPYYGGPEGFEQVYEMLTGACAGLLRAVNR